MKIENYIVYKDYKWKLKTTNYARIINENWKLQIVQGI